MYKQLMLLIAAACLFHPLKAQYFERLYGSTDIDMATDGHNAYEGGNVGHFQIGPYDGPGTANDHYFTAQRTDLDGLISGAPYFNNRYFVTDIFGTGWISPNANLKITELKSMEQSNGSGFAVIGSYGTGIFWAPILPDGTAPGYAAFRYLPASNGSNITVAAVVEDPSTNYIYVAGSIKIGNATEVYAMALVNTPGPNFGDISWSKTYDIDDDISTSDIALDMIVSPYNTTDLVLVGGTRKSYQSGDAFAMKIDRTNLGSILNVNIYSQNWDKGEFTCIKASANPNIGSPENFVIGGTVYNYDLPHESDMWMVALDNANMDVRWSDTYNHADPSMPPYTYYDECADIAERINTSGDYEYFLAGTTTYPNYRDRVVLKFDDVGRPVIDGQYTYVKYEADDLVSIDLLEGFGPNIDGLSLFGSSSWNPGIQIGNWDHSLVKTYFNGVTGCNLMEDEQHVATIWASTKTPSTMFDVSDGFNKYDFFVSINTPVIEVKVCYDPMPAGGSNARAQKADKNIVAENSFDDAKLGTGIQDQAMLTVYPSVLQGQSNEVSIRGQFAYEGQAVLRLVDMNGKVLKQSGLQINEGATSLIWPLSDIQMIPGVYHLQLSGNNYQQTFKVVVAQQ